MSDHFFLYNNHESFDYANEKLSRKIFLHLKPGEVFVDVGAFVGSWTLPALAMGAKVYAIEGNPDAVKDLQKNIKLNWDKPDITIGNFLVSDVPGENVFYDGWRIWNHDCTNRIDIKVDTLDNYLSTTHVDFIKIDVEGAELKVLTGAKDLIERCKPKMLVEVHTGIAELDIKVGVIIDYVLSLYSGYSVIIVPQDGGDYYHVFFHDFKSPQLSVTTFYRNYVKEVVTTNGND